MNRDPANVSRKEMKALCRLARQGGVDVTEIFSPARVTQVCEEEGLTPGTSMDLTTKDEHGRWWDFNDPEMRRAAERKIVEEKPPILIGTPVCTDWCSMQAVNIERLGPVEWNRRMTRARTHLNFVCRLYRLQASEGRYYLHEHPATATSWQLPNIEGLKPSPNVESVVANM